MRYLGIDYGEKRIGLALSDEGGKIALPYRTVARARQTEREITAIVKKEGVKKIIIGAPIPFSGDESQQSRAVKKFGGALSKQTRVPIEYENELFTTAMARKQGIPAKHLDKAAAVIILQSYLDKIRNTKSKIRSTKQIQSQNVQKFKTRF